MMWKILKSNQRTDSIFKTLELGFVIFGGEYRTRTDHLKHAMLALYQMS